MARANLTELGVRALKPAGRQYKVWDIQTPAFGVQVGKIKSWFVVYGRKRTFKTIGRVGDLSLADARKTARKFLANATEKMGTLTFGEALERYYDIHLPTLRPSTRQTRKRVFERHYRTWDDKELTAITPSLIIQTLDGLLKTPSEASHAFRDLKTFFNWCVQRQYLETSPCARLKPPTRPKARDRVLSEEELKRVFRAAESLGGPFGCIVRLLICWGTRRGETAALQWDWIQGDTLTIPGEATKNGHPHTLPVLGMAKGILAEVPHLNTSPYLFPGRGIDTPFNGFSALKVKLDARAGVAFGLHDLRRTWVSMNARWTPPHILERAVNHRSGVISGVSAVYNRHLYETEVRACYERWDKFLQQLTSS